MSKAEDRAWDAYPRRIESSCGFREDIYEYHRKAYIEGYQQAEKDLELTWKDMELIYEISCDVFNEQDGHFYNVSKIWEEILKRFKDFRERKEK